MKIQSVKNLGFILVSVFFFLFLVCIAFLYFSPRVSVQPTPPAIITLPQPDEQPFPLEKETPPESTLETTSSTPLLEIAAPTSTLTVATTSPQFVVLAFDGSYSLNKWKETLDFAKEMKLLGKPIHYTYFLSGVYFLGAQFRELYIPPQHPAGSSAIGFAFNKNDIKARVGFVNQAIADGHEIGSHLNGHYSGATWTKEEWNQEMGMFDTIMFNIAKNNHVADSPAYRINLTPQDIVGLRAPELGNNNAMFEVLHERGYAYDTSLSAKQDAWPVQLPSGLWEFPLGRIKYADAGTDILSMDYNFYFKQSKGVDTATKGSPEWQDFYDKTYSSFINYFNHNYEGNHAPVFIASHFSDWNDGVYWEAMKDFASVVCGKPQVQCVSYREVMEYMNGRKK